MRSVKPGYHFVRLLVLALLSAVCAETARAQTAPTTTVIIVRHAEKAESPPDDPPLTTDGDARAAALSAALRDAAIRAIYSTEFARTRNTAEPISRRFGVPVEVLPYPGNAGAFAAQIAERIRRDHIGETVLVVGHSNTVPALVEALGAPSIGTIEDHEYDHLLIVLLLPDGRASLVRARYGDPS